MISIFFGMHSTTCRVVRGGKTAFCKVTMTLTHVAGTVLGSRGTVVPLSICLSKRCGRGSIFVNIPTIVGHSNVHGVVRVPLSSTRRRGVSLSTAALGGILRRKFTDLRTSTGWSFPVSGAH